CARARTHFIRLRPADGTLRDGGCRMMPRSPAPDDRRNDLPTGAALPPVDAPHPVYRWYHVLGSAALIAICTAMGLFLLVFPWSAFWEANSYVLQAPAIQD